MKTKHRENRKSEPMRGYQKLALWIAGGLVVIWLYGTATDRPGTAGYSYCSPAEIHRLKYGH